mmetsp:Transcript_9713/g.39509  ORF Transcript_9713/g.39509 Transcript_9713/m.39509 type:complete len:238 (+) Transcript_9713:419-1132(+)
MEQHLSTSMFMRTSSMERCCSSPRPKYSPRRASFKLPALWPNFFLSSGSVSTTASGLGGARPAFVNWLSITLQSKAFRLWPAQIRPSSMSKMRWATASNLGALSAIARVMWLQSVDRFVTFSLYTRVWYRSTSTYLALCRATAPNSSRSVAGMVVSKSKKTRRSSLLTARAGGEAACREGMDACLWARYHSASPPPTAPRAAHTFHGAIDGCGSPILSLSLSLSLLGSARLLSSFTP